jgi:hypothetical protein
MLLQAKSLHPRQRSDGIYGQLHHIVGRGPTARDQVDILIAGTKKPLVSMYLSYNGLAKKPAVRSGCGSMNGFAKKNGRLGLTVSSADVVIGCRRSASLQPVTTRGERICNPFRPENASPTSLVHKRDIRSPALPSYRICR